MNDASMVMRNSVTRQMNKLCKLAEVKAFKFPFEISLPAILSMEDRNLREISKY